MEARKTWEKGVAFFAFAMAEAIKRAEDKSDEDWYRDRSNAVQIGEWLSQLMLRSLFRNTGREER